MEFAENAGGGDGGQQGAPSEGGGQQQGGVDLSPITSRLDEQAETFGSRLGALEQHLGMGEEEYVDPYDDGGEGYVDDDGTVDHGEGQYVDPEQQQAAQQMQALEALIDQRARQQAEELVSPAMQQAQETERYIQYRALEERYPDLGPEGEWAERTWQEARQRGFAMDMSEAQAAHPDFLEQVYLSMRALEGADGEMSAAEQDPGMVLEGGGGASRAQPEEDPGEAILRSGNRRLPFQSGGYRG